MFKGGIRAIHLPSRTCGWITAEKFVTVRENTGAYKIVRHSVRFLDDKTLYNVLCLRRHDDPYDPKLPPESGYFDTPESQKYRLLILSLGGSWYCSSVFEEVNE